MPEPVDHDSDLERGILVLGLASLCNSLAIAIVLYLLMRHLAAEVTVG